MPLVEVDDRELAEYQKLTGFLRAGLSNPKTRRKILEVQRALNPDAAIPELDAAAPVQDELAEVRKTLAEMNKSLADDKAEREQAKRLAALQRDWDKGRAKLRKQGYVDEGIAAVEAFMEEKGVADHEVGAAAFERLHPATEPVNPISGNRFDIFGAKAAEGDANLKALFANPDDRGALNGLIAESLKAVRGR
jgi:hypothetical protein